MGCNTSHIPGQKYLFPSICYVSSYCNPQIAIGFVSRISYAISMAPYCIDFLWHLLLVLISLLSMMLIGVGVLMIERTLVLIVFSLLIVLFRGNVPSKKWCLGSLLNLSTMPLPMLPLNFCGFSPCCLNCKLSYALSLYLYVTIWVSNISPKILFYMQESSTLGLIIISFEIMLWKGTLIFAIFHLKVSSLMCSPNRLEPCNFRCFKSISGASMSHNLRKGVRPVSLNIVS